MPETVSKGLQVPTTGSLPGTWGAVALNPNFEALDGMLGGFTTLPLSNSNVTLSAPVGYSATPGSGPTQSQNALITFTGTLLATVTVTFPLPGYYLVQNLCEGNFLVRLAASTPSRIICAPPGEVVQVFNTGTDMFYVGLGRVGSYEDLGTATVPAWITNCTVPPYLLCNGTTFSSATYPVLASLLGGTTLPDARGRARYTLDGGTNRITTAGSGVDGTTLRAGGGDQLMQTHTHTATVTDPGHNHTVSSGTAFTGSSGGVGMQASVQTTSTNVTGISVTNASAGSGSSQNMPPVYIGGITLIRAA